MSWQDYETKSTEELIELIKLKDTPGQLKIADNAYTAFMFRFQDDLLNKCEVIARNWGFDMGVAVKIAEQTFVNFFRSATRFTMAKCKLKDINKCIKIYLYKIAQHELANYAKSVINPNPYKGDEEIVVVDFVRLNNLKLEGEDLGSLNKLYLIVNEALDGLSNKHKIIFLTYLVHEKHGFKLPRKLLAELRQELKLTQDTIRVYKKEASEKFEEYKRNGNK